jgi:dipeptidyl aminopeptidase/acylaminoacyl peptidase
VQTTSSFIIPEGAKFIGLNDAGDAVFAEDTELGSFISTLSSRGITTVLMQANEHVAAIRRPVTIAVRYRVRGQKREGVLYLPTERRFGDRPPVLVTAYPSPSPWAPLFPDYVGKVNSIFAWRWHPLLAAGFAVFVVDFRRARPVDPSSKAYIETPKLVTSEINPAIEALKGLKQVNGDRLGFVGFSYGGYTALTLLGHSNAFSAIAAESALSSLVQSFTARPELHIQDCAPAIMASGFWEVEDPAGFFRIGGPSYLRRDRMISDSPLLNLQDAKTPTLLIAGEMDTWGAGQDAVYMTLLRKGVDTQLVTYFGEEHTVESPGNVRDLISREIAWFTKYLVQ